MQSNWSLIGLIADLIGFSILAVDLLRTQKGISNEHPLKEEVRQLADSYDADIKRINISANDRASEIQVHLKNSDKNHDQLDAAVAIANASNSSSTALDISVRTALALDDFVSSLVKLERNLALRNFFSSQLTLLAIMLILAGFLMQIIGALPQESYLEWMQALRWTFPKAFELLGA